MTTDEFTMYDAAYVLGALSPADRREFENHLRVCAECAGAVGELAGLPGLMSRVSIDQLTAEPEPVPETLLPALARAARRERIRRRMAVGAAAAAAACLVTIGAMAVADRDAPDRPPVARSDSTPPGSTPSGSTPPGSANLALSAVVPSPVTASARLVDLAWGTRVDLTCTYDTSGQSVGGRSPAGGFPYALVVVDRTGAAQQVATWKALPNRRLTVVGTSSRSRTDIAAVEIRTQKGRTILRLTT
jgi:Putative zinc-finger